MVVLPVRAAAVVVRLTETSGITISIVMPTFNEATHLHDTLTAIYASIDQAAVEVIIADGGSSDQTLDIAQQFPCQIVSSETGRARQMNQGCQQAKGEWLVFLHADSRLPKDWQTNVLNTLQWGFFPVRLSGQRWPLRIIEKAMNLRSSITRVGTGDQGLFFRQSFFRQVGGFAEIPIMEDIAICKQARQLSSPAIAKSAIITSSRRWEENGIIKTVLLMWWLRLAYWFGTSPERLHRIYYPQHCR